MMDKFQNKYRIPSARHPHWDYRHEGAYFITICTQHRVHYFGKIQNGKMVLTNVGVIADILWHEIPIHARQVELGAFVVMPNHVHGILILPGGGGAHANVQTGHALSLSPPHVQTGHALSLSPPQPHVQTGHALSLPPQQRFQNIGKNSVSSIIGSYKSAVTKHARRLGFEFEWQTRFHDHIIRNDESFERITNYIINNPVKWQEDKFFDI